MNIQTMSIVVGNNNCNAKCPFCISKQTGLGSPFQFNFDKIRRNFNKACRLAQIGKVTTVLLTGKGEPTLYTSEISQYLYELQQFNFPFVELQTNGIELYKNINTPENFVFNKPTKDCLENWYEQGLTTIIISVVHYNYDKNKRIFTPGSYYINLEVLIKYLKSLGFIVRLNVTMLKDYIDSSAKITDFIDFAKLNNVDQITFRPVKAIKSAIKNKITEYTKQNQLTAKQLSDIFTFFENQPNKLLDIPNVGTIYDINDITVCNATCLTRSPDNPNELRQIIFYGNGKLMYDWELNASTLLPQLL